MRISRLGEIMSRISVVMSVFNEENHLSDAIESILNQTYADFEFIICDDASEDNSVNIIRRYMELDRRIILLQNDKNMGLAASLNKGIRAAKGEFIARMDADDISLSDRFEKQVNYLDYHRNLAFVCGGAHLFDDNGIWGQRVYNIPLTKENIFKYRPVIHPTVMIRKEILDHVGGYTVSTYTRRGQDYDLWCKIYSYGYIAANMNEILLNYRENKDSYKRRRFKYRIHSCKVRRYWRRKLKLPFLYELYAFKPIIAGLIPPPIMRWYHRKKFSSST